MNKKKIKNLIVLLVVMTIVAITSIFYKPINRVVLNCLFNNMNVVTSRNNLLVHFIDVGQGDAVAITFPTDKTMLIDTGSSDVSVEYIEYLKANVFNHSKTKTIDYLILTHADEDHIGGALKLLTEFDVGCVYMPCKEKTSNAYLALKNYIQTNCNYKVISNELTIQDSGCKISTYGPFNVKDDNDSCPIIKIEYQGKSFLFTGDVSVEAERSLINIFGEQIDSDVLKVAHHGAKDSTSKEFLESVNPKYAVISVGENSHGHPTEEVIKNLQEQNIDILRTDKVGDVLFAVGDYYNLKYKTNDFYITDLSLDCRVYIVILEISLFVVGTIILFKKDKQKR